MGTADSDLMEREFTYVCTCGRPVGSRTDPSKDPRVVIGKVMHKFDFGFDEVESRVDFRCRCGLDYDGSGAWVDRDTLPAVEPPVAMFVAKPEIPPHFNPAFNCEVESRKHLEYLQRVHGCEDADGLGKGKIDSHGALPFTPTNATTAHSETVARVEKAVESVADALARDEAAQETLRREEAALDAEPPLEVDPIRVPAQRVA